MNSPLLTKKSVKSRPRASPRRGRQPVLSQSVHAPHGPLWTSPTHAKASPAWGRDTIRPLGQARHCTICPPPSPRQNRMVLSRARRILSRARGHGAADARTYPRVTGIWSSLQLSQCMVVPGCTAVQTRSVPNGARPQLVTCGPAAVAPAAPASRPSLLSQFFVCSLSHSPSAWPQRDQIPTSLAGVRAMGSRVLGFTAWSHVALETGARGGGGGFSEIGSQLQPSTTLQITIEVKKGEGRVKGEGFEGVFRCVGGIVGDSGEKGMVVHTNVRARQT